MKTKLTIAGREIELESGNRYVAMRDVSMYTRGKQFDVRIFDLTHGFSPNLVPAFVIPLLTIDQANEFLAAFNNEQISLSGREWS